MKVLHSARCDLHVLLRTLGEYQRVTVRISNRKLSHSKVGIFGSPSEWHSAAQLVGQLLDALRENVKRPGKRRLLIATVNRLRVENDRHAVAPHFRPNRFALNWIITGLRNSEYLQIKLERTPHVSHEQARQ